MAETPEMHIVSRFLSEFHKSRSDILTSILCERDLPFEIEHERPDCNNIVVPMNKEGQEVLLVAHHDIVSGSTGINDNTCAVALLIHLATRLHGKELKMPVRFLFSDQEEMGMVGSSAYAARHKHELSQVLVFDIIGYGDCHVYGTHEFSTFKFLQSMGIRRLSNVLPSDNLAFARHDLPSALITAAHDDDMLFMEDMYTLKPNPKFYTSFHNGERDNDVSVIDFDMIKSLGDRLYDLLTINDNKAIQEIC